MKKLTKKAQSSIEFAVLITFMMLFLTVFSGFIQSKTAEAQDARNRNQVNKVKDIIFSEIISAEGMPVNYSKNFSLPNYIDGSDYSINIVEGIELNISFRQKEHVYFFPYDFNDTSSIGRGNNQLQKTKTGTEINYKIVKLP